MKEKALHSEQGQGWLITFADLLSLLLTFFVLLFSMSTVHLEGWNSIVTTMSEQFNKERPKVEMRADETVNQLTKTNAAGLNLNYLRVLLERAIAGHASFDGVRVYRHKNKVLISIPSERLFEGQGIGLTVGAEQPLQKLAGTLAQIRNGIRVISKADATPVLNSSYRSRWELSMARARVVAGILTDFGYTKSIDVLGRVDSLVAGSLSQSLAQGSTIDIVIAADEKQDSLYDVL